MNATYCASTGIGELDLEELELVVSLVLLETLVISSFENIGISL